MTAKFGKGDRVGIVSGRSGKGMRGEVFWIGESRYGKGTRYGIRGDDGETYWVDEQHLGAETDVPEPELPGGGREPLEKGTRVRITRGEAAGTTGEIFWVGEKKFGRGMRYGVRGDDEQTHWVDDVACEPLDEASAPSAGGSAGPPFDDDAPPPDDDDAPFEDEGFDDEPPF